MKSLRRNRGILLGGSGLEEGWEGMEGGREQNGSGFEERGKTNAVVSRMHTIYIVTTLPPSPHPCRRQLSVYLP